MAETPLPRALQKQVDRAEQILKERTAPPAQSQAPSNTPQQRAEPPAQPAPAPQPAQRPAPQPQQGEDAGHWRQRFSTVEGILKSERERHRTQVSDLEARLEALQKQAQQAPRSTPQTSDGRVSLPEGSVAQSLREHDHDPELVGAFETLERNNAGLQQRLEQALEANRALAAQVASVQTNVGRTLSATYEEQLDQRIPDRDQIDYDPDFGLYMQEVDPYIAEATGIKKTRQELLLEAHAARDARRVIGFYQRFKDMRGQPRQHANPSPPIDPAPSVGSGEGLANGPTYTVGQYATLMNNIATGKIKGDEAARLEQELNLAVRQGRITGLPRQSGGVMNPNDFGTLPG